MDDDVLNDIAAKIANEECVLFAGAGLSSVCGGPSWTELLEATAREFDYQDPMLDVIQQDESTDRFDYFDIFSDIVAKNDVEEVHDFVSSQLENISLHPPVSELAGLPWYATFTTNYDSAFEEALRNRNKDNVRKVLTDSDYAMSGLPKSLLHVQLMGSMERGPSNEGSMVLTAEEKRSALDTRSAIFERLEAHAANLSFLFLGYSFKDDIFTDVFRGISSNLGKPDNTYYALFHSELDPADRSFVESQNIEPIIGDLEEFSEKLVPKVHARNPYNSRQKSIPVGKERLDVPKHKIREFLSDNSPVLAERFDNENVSLRSFLKGDLSSFHPFKNGWHYEREEVDEVVNSITDSETSAVIVSGQPGSGRSFIIHAAVERLISKHEGMGFQIFNTDLSPIPDSSKFNRFVGELRSANKQIRDDLPKFAVFFSEGMLTRGELFQFHMFRSNTDIPVYCIIEDHTNAENPEVNDLNTHIVDVGHKIEGEEREDFIRYLIEITDTKELDPLTDEMVRGYLREDPDFLSVMYHALYPTQQSIEDIVDQEYNGINNKNAKLLVELTSLGSTVDVDIPISVCRRFLSENGEGDPSYRDVFELATGEASTLLKIQQDVQNVQRLSIYHPVIAGYLTRSLTVSRMDEILEGISKCVNLQVNHEGSFINELLISKGVNLDPSEEPPYSQDGLQSAFEILKQRQPARPIVHHLGRLMADRGAKPEEFLSVLKEALEGTDENYALEEDRENILTTMAHKLWESKKPRLSLEDVSHPEIQDIFDYIERARRYEDGLYSYEIQSRILLEMAQNQEGERVVEIVNEAIRVIEKGLSRGGDYEWKKRLRNRKVELWSEIDEEKAESIARELLESHDRGDGYYTLAALYYYDKQNSMEALNYLDKAMQAENYPAQTPYLRLQILLEEQFGNYDKMLELVAELEKDDDFEANWKSTFIKAVVYFINGMGEQASDYFVDAWQSAPREERYGATYFWNENRSRKVFKGKVGSNLTSSEGSVYNHEIEGWDEDIYFNPEEQETEPTLESGMKVEFELGFSPKGPVAWDLRVVESYK